MAKVCMVERDRKRKKLAKRDKNKRAKLKALVMNKETPIEERFAAIQKLAEMPRNGAKIRVRNRCALTGRPRGYYRKVNLSRIALREMGSDGLVPGLVKSSW